MRETSAKGLIEDLQARIRAALGPLLPAGGLALVDIPNHSNVGDSAIWLGELAYFRKERGAPPAYVATIDSFDAAELRAAAPEGPILIHGGGNFGDIWPAHQAFRHRVLAQFRDRPVIQLPQSIHFGDAEAVRETARAIAAHGDFTLMVRDQASFDMAREAFDCAVVLCPDMAFHIGPVARPRRASVDQLYLLRTDKERVVAAGEVHDEPGRIAVRDWAKGDRLGGWKTAALRGAVGGLFAPRQGPAETLATTWRTLAERRFRSGARLLASGRVVITDRLHAHIISLLLDLPHATLDNSYGKLERFIGLWTCSYRGLRRAASLAEARRWAEVACSRAAPVEA